MKTNKVNKVVVCLAIGAFGLAGCSAKVSGAGGSIPGDLSALPGSSNPTLQQPAQAAATALEGRWKLATCSSVGAQMWATGEIDFSGTTYSSIMDVYADAQCTKPFGPAQTQFGSFTLPSSGQINFTQANGENDFDVYEVDSKVLYMGLQPGFAATSRPQSVDRDLGYTYVGAAVIVND
jgi:hypothetical protein